MEDEKDEQHCNQSQHIEKPTVCDEELNHKKEYEGSQMNVSSYFSNSEIFCQEEICFLDPIEERNDVSGEAYKEYEVLKS